MRRTDRHLRHHHQESAQLRLTAFLPSSFSLHTSDAGIQRIAAPLIEWKEEELEGAGDLDDTLKRTTLLESKVWNMLFSFQKDGVKGSINKILAYNGCILADSVGLGKTFEALAVIKYFELRNERVLVLCPKKLRQNWTVYRSNSRLNPLLDDGLGYDVLSHTDLSREGGLSGDLDLANLNWGNYGLIVIDESHNFRNNAVGKEKEDGSRRRSRYERLMEDVIQSGMKTKVLLLSATPVNNQIADIRNQISIIAGGDVARSEDPAHDGAFREKLGVPSVKETTRQAQSKFTTWTKKPPAQRKTRDLINQLGSDLFKLLDGLSIARSRAQIKRYYAKELATLGGFPERDKPHAEYPEIDAEGRFLTFKRLDAKISGLTLSLYHPSSYLRKDLPQSILDQYAQRIGNFTQEGRERILISMMKVNFLKRLESSIDSFRLTLSRTIQKIDDLKAKIESFQDAKNQKPTFDFANLSDEDFDDLDVDPEDLIESDLHYRNKQLKRLQNEILDLEDLDEDTISLADFSLADFRLDLLRFLEANREALESSPLGLYAVVPPDPQVPATQPGILFCFRQRDDRRPTEVNPLAPHYLVYVLDDGNVRLTFAQPKQSLEVFRTLAAGQSSPLNNLCDLFDDRTKNGADMAHENSLLARAVESIKATFGKRAAASLFSGRDGMLPSTQDTPASSADLELVTWLVIADPAAS